MITIAEEHYQKMLELIRTLNRNMILINPSSEELKGLLTDWMNINSHLGQLYNKLQKNLQQILTRNSELQNENTELNSKLQGQRNQNNTLIQTNTMLRAQLAKDQAQLSKYKEGIKKLKQSHREKMIQKDEIITELERKVKKYKKISEDQQKKFEKLDKKITQITEYQIAQRSSMKQQELDQELLELQNMYKDLDQGEPHEFTEGSDTQK